LEDNIEKDLQEVGLRDTGWIEVARNRDRDRDRWRNLRTR